MKKKFNGRVPRTATHPGKILAEGVFPALGLDTDAAAAALDMPAKDLGAILEEKAPVTAPLALKLGKMFRNSPEFWLNLQQAHDLTAARRNSDVKKSLRKVAALPKPK